MKELNPYSSKKDMPKSNTHKRILKKCKSKPQRFYFSLRWLDLARQKTIIG
jgi:hypothetical protein